MSDYLLIATIYFCISQSKIEHNIFNNRKLAIWWIMLAIGLSIRL